MQFAPAKAKRGPFLIILIVILVATTIFIAGLSIRTIWGASNLSYDLAPSQLLIHFGPSTTRVDRDAIISAEILDDPGRGRRLAGTNIPGLYEGRWSFDETGNVTLYATSLRPLTVIETSERKWGISPDDPESFIATLLQGETGEFSPVASDNASGIVVLLFLPILAAAIPIVLIVYVVRTARRIGYELRGEGLVITGGGKPIVLRYADITDVETIETQGRPLKTAGIAMPGLYWGSFSWRRVAPNLKLYATSLSPLVLVRTKGRAFGLSPENVEKFIVELERRRR